MPLGVKSEKFRALGFPRIISLLQAVLLKHSLKGFFMAKKHIAEAGHPWEDQGKAYLSTRDEALFAEIAFKNQSELGVLLFIYLSSIRGS